jgi:hypothetical protein
MGSSVRGGGIFDGINGILGREKGRKVVDRINKINGIGEAG